MILAGWSTAGGRLEVAAHLAAMRHACKQHESDAPGVSVVEVQNASLEALTEALESLRTRRQRVAVLHLLCHGGELPGSRKATGLWLNDSRLEEEVRLVGPQQLAAALSPYAGLVRAIVLCASEGACRGDAGNALGDAARHLHRAGFAAVLVSRVPLSDQGAMTLTGAFYGGLLSGAPFHQAVACARKALGNEWAALQVHARASDGPQYPVLFKPYRGLLYFQGKDRRFFFGREALISRLEERVLAAGRGERPRFQLLAGASGCGKSSLVRAGLLPALERHLDDWRVVAFRPRGDKGAGDAGVAKLARKLREARGGPAAPASPADEAAVEAEIKCLRERWSGPLLLVIDQLEEAFRLPEGEAERFLRCLWRLSQDAALRTVVLGTVRADFVEQARAVALAPGVTLGTVYYREEHRLFVPDLDAAELLEVIERPLRQVGLRFDAGVAERLRDEAGREPGALPLLEHALDALWKARVGGRLTQEAYCRLGLSGAMGRRLDELWDRRSPGQRREAQKLLVALVEIAEDVRLSTRRRRRLDELRPSRTSRAGHFDRVLELLVAERLLVRSGQEKDAGVESGEGTGSGGRVEIAHEALVRRWPRLQEWLRLEREQVQRRKVRAARLTAASLALSVFGALSLAHLAYEHRQPAQNAALRLVGLAGWFSGDQNRPPEEGRKGGDLETAREFLSGGGCHRREPGGGTIRWWVRARPWRESRSAWGGEEETEDGTGSALQGPCHRRETGEGGTARRQVPARASHQSSCGAG